METPVIGSVPILPTMMLSSMFTRLVMPVWSMIGRAIIMVLWMNFLSNVSLSNFIV